PGPSLPSKNRSTGTICGSGCAAKSAFSALHLALSIGETFPLFPENRRESGNRFPVIVRFRVWSGGNTEPLEEREVLLRVACPILARHKQEKLMEGAFNFHDEHDGLGRSRFAVDSIVTVESAAIPPGASKLKLSSWFFSAESCS